MKPGSVAVGPHYEQNPPNTFVFITIDAPCSLFRNYSNSNLSLAQEPCMGLYLFDSMTGKNASSAGQASAIVIAKHG
jgi:hypothetical protein